MPVNNNKKRRHTDSSTSLGVLPPVDGSLGEGGGQVIRVTASNSAMTRKNADVTHIRAKRPKPGLQEQHAACVKAVVAIAGGGKLFGCEVGSSTLRIEWDDDDNHVPQTDADGVEIHNVQINTAGATTLVIQACLPPLLMPHKPPVADRVRLSITGGTDASFAPTVDYTKHVFLPTIRRMFQSLDAQLDVQRRGFYPIGGGKIQLSLNNRSGHPPAPLNLEMRGETKNVTVRVVHVSTKRASELGEQFITVMRSSPSFAQGVTYGEVLVESAQGCKIGGGSRGGVGSLLVTLETSCGALLGYNTLFAKGDTDDKITQAFTNLVQIAEKDAASNACLDRPMTDQILPYLACAAGNSRVAIRAPLTPHAVTSLQLLEEQLGTSFTFHRADGIDTMGILTCTGRRSAE
ncbi:hypothetical protein PPROV_000044100 [Pycnococcus provasolii]|uniref:RNA 3'-terminal phosphate cyclase domain-containing protein n=2 Tax=Pycnococcus provasolii TaxID=41880 RepID=A0A830H3T4_9CHLO|nr:hypothetical protein PPROV_000044100 [Pycnococcus provasolii]